MKDRTFKLGQKIYVPFEGESPFEIGERVLLGEKYYCELKDIALGVLGEYLVMTVVGIVDFEGALI